MKTAENKERRPFHETIVDVINLATTKAEIAQLARLIIKTKIPKNHDEIIAAWKESINFLDWTDAFDVVKNLLEQKQEAEEEAEKAK